jgi:hypothetical protein
VSADDDRTYLETACAQCLIRVSAWGGSPEWRSVYVSILSEHLPLERWCWRGRNGRIRTAWRVLRRGWHDPELEFDKPDELDAFLNALSKAYSVAFGSSIVLMRQPGSASGNSA